MTATAFDLEVQARLAEQQATVRVLDATLAAAAVQSTSTAIAAETIQALAAAATEQAVRTTATADAAFGAANATAMAGIARSVQLAEERERMTNPAKAWLPFVMLPLSLAAVLLFGWRWSRTRVVQRDARGDAPLLVIGDRIYDADRNPAPLMDVKNPQRLPQEILGAVIQRDQMIDLATRGSSPAGDGGRRRMMARQMAQQSIAAPKVEALPAEQARELVGGVWRQIVADAITAEVSDDQQA